MSILPAARSLYDCLQPQHNHGKYNEYHSGLFLILPATSDLWLGLNNKEVCICEICNWHHHTPGMKIGVAIAFLASLR